MNPRDVRYRWEAFRPAQFYMFGKPVQPVVPEELAGGQGRILRKDFSQMSWGFNNALSGRIGTGRETLS